MANHYTSRTCRFCMRVLAAGVGWRFPGCSVPHVWPLLVAMLRSRVLSFHCFLHSHRTPGSPFWPPRAFFWRLAKRIPHCVARTIPHGSLPRATSMWVGASAAVVLSVRRFVAFVLKFFSLRHKWCAGASPTRSGHVARPAQTLQRTSRLRLAGIVSTVLFYRSSSSSSTLAARH